MSDAISFREVGPGTFLAAWERAVQAVRERPPVTETELTAGWREDPSGSGLRHNEITGEWDDTCFVHLAPIRPRGGG
jgi:hypothetical protein